MYAREIRRKIKENERKWEINDKKASKKQLTTFGLDFVSSILVLFSHSHIV